MKYYIGRKVSETDHTLTFEEVDEGEVERRRQEIRGKLMDTVSNYFVVEVQALFLTNNLFYPGHEILWMQLVQPLDSNSTNVRGLIINPPQVCNLQLHEYVTVQFEDIINIKYEPAKRQLLHPCNITELNGRIYAGDAWLRRRDGPR